jgi:ElaB/YqjD/DUF883 family membrane-anchored ribosome-binding protein
MSTDPDEIRRNIESTRHELGSDMDALTNRVNPKRMASERVDRARGAMGSIRERVMGTAAHAGESGSAAASSAAHQVSEAGHQVSEAGHSVREKAGSAGRRQIERTQGSPLAAGMIAFGLGVLVSSLLPPSPSERQAAGRVRGKVAEHSGEIKEQLAGAAHQAQDNLRQPAQQAVESVRSRATQGASAVQEQGRSAAQDVRGQAGAARENVQRR